MSAVAAAVALAVVVGDDLRVGHDLVGEDEREPLAQGVPEPAGQAPLGALPLDAVHVERDLRAAQPRQEGEERVGGVDEQDRVVAVEDGVQRAHGRVGDRLEVLAAQPAHPAPPTPGGSAARLIGAAAVRVDRDLMAARRQLARQLPGERLEAAIRRWDAPATKDGEAHPTSSSYVASSRSRWRTRE